ncbi:MAG: transposase [Aquificales bacterium]|nr:transposase [Aquificales bacterium]
MLVTTDTTLFLIGRRSWDVIADALAGFAGWLMSDGYRSYRQYAKRLRCLAHLLRKARGLAESLNPEAQAFGEKTLAYMAEFIKGIYRAREGPGMLPKEEFSEQLSALKGQCEKQRDSTHEKTRVEAKNG